ncbi:MULTISPECIES: DUF5344 family protein [Peribacillus]|uniref:DUF5344 family protein n=1 Tax=Peribacillus TaxID=2675229 RepID=UPI001F4EFEBF|nr:MULTISPECIES: DUF5344 family protein [unclassified Peribacillus]MCK1984202.1 YwqI/YxiC family protein [Peribacillus sp. Aquil_B1]MCK2008372.1 YwqI/YxiC family protein [Peribacillus sp. Aquil_B8]
MAEIKIEYNNIENVLKMMESASDSFEPHLPKNLVQNSRLDILQEIDGINTLLEKIMEDYKNLLTNNELMVQKSVEYMKESDEFLKTIMSVNAIAEVRK